MPVLIKGAKPAPVPGERRQTTSALIIGNAQGDMRDYLDNSEEKSQGAPPSFLRMNTIRKNPQVDKKVSEEQYHLEMQLHKQSSYKLTREDVEKVLL